MSHLRSLSLKDILQQIDRLASMPPSSKVLGTLRAEVARAIAQKGEIVYPEAPSSEEIRNRLRARLAAYPDATITLVSGGFLQIGYRINFPSLNTHFQEIADDKEAAYQALIRRIDAFEDAVRGLAGRLAEQEQPAS